MTNTNTNREPCASEEFEQVELKLGPKLDELDAPLKPLTEEQTLKLYGRCGMTLSLIIFGGGPNLWSAKVPHQAFCKATWSNGRWMILWNKREVIYDEAEEPTAEALARLEVVKSNVDPPDLVQKILAVVKKEKEFVTAEMQNSDSDRAPLCPRP